MAPASALVNLNSTPDEAGLRFTAGAAWSLHGAFAALTISTTGNGPLVLYDGAGAELASATIQGQGATTGGRVYLFLFSAPVALASGGVYRLAYRPVSATNHTVNRFDYLNADAFALNPLGSSAAYTTRANLGAWADAANSVPMISPIYSASVAGGASAGAASIFGSALISSARRLP